MGARLYRRIAEPVLELCTDGPIVNGTDLDYTGNAHYSVRVLDLYIAILIGE